MASVVFNVRMPEENVKAFRARASELMTDPADLAREVLIAAAENRITIRPSEEELQRKKLKQEIYPDD